MSCCATWPGWICVRRFREELAPYLATAPFGRNDFEGFRSQRLYALLTKARATAELVAHPAVLELVDAVLDAPCLLSANIAINVHPGETAQSLHPDDGYCGVPRPRRPVRRVGGLGNRRVHRRERRNGGAPRQPPVR